MKIRENYTCPLELVHDMVKGKWKPIILWRLRQGTASFSVMQKTIEGITDKMLMQHLGELVEFGFVERKAYEGYPLRVEYTLTDPYGLKMIEALRIMQSIGIDYFVEHGMAYTLEERGVAPELGSDYPRELDEDDEPELAVGCR